MPVTPIAVPPPGSFVRRCGPGTNAMRFTSASAHGMLRSSATAGIAVAAVTPRPFATTRHSVRPTITPPGMPITKPTIPRVVACHATVACTWRRVNPSVLRSASSRPRLRTAVTNA